MTKLKVVILCLILALTALCAVGCMPVISAYDIAVENGFTGTEEQWLLSLRGKDGTDGSSLNIDDIYARATEEGYTGSYLDFIKEFFGFEMSPDNSAAVSKGLRSAVLVRCFFGSSAYGQAGAGVIYKINKESKSAYIITNYHVVYSSSGKTQTNIADKITVVPYGESEINAVYVGGTATYDIAVLKVESDYFTSDVAAAVKVADSNNISVGQTAIAIGNPAASGMSVTQGIISVDSEYITMSDIENSAKSVDMRVMRIDAPVNSGNSGGGLFDANGDLIGIVNAKISDSSIENMAYAIPSSIATAVADNIIRNTVFKKGTIGISVQSVDSKAYIGSDGLIKVSESVVIASVDGAATGKLEVGDVILSINFDREIAVTRQFHVIDAVLRTTPGDAVTFTVLRDGEEVSVQVICG